MSRCESRERQHNGQPYPCIDVRSSVESKNASSGDAAALRTAPHSELLAVARVGE